MFLLTPWNYSSYIVHLIKMSKKTPEFDDFTLFIYLFLNPGSYIALVVFTF